MTKFIQNVRLGFRLLWKNPGFSATTILILGLGIGAATAIFTVVDAVLLKSLPFREAERLVWVWGKWPGGDQASISAPDLEDFRGQNRSFDHLAAFANELTPFNLTEGGEPERVNGYYVTADFFSALGVTPALGRTFSPDEEKAGRDRVVILSHGLWQRRFGGDPRITERPVKINGEEYTVAGVMPPGVDFPKKAEVWVPMPFYLPEMNIRRAHSLRPVGRLKPGVALGQAQADLDLIARGLEQQYPDSNSGWGVRLVPLRDQLVGEVRTSLLLLLGATFFVLLIACVNVANLLLVRATARQKEFALRAALGAGRGRLIRQLLAESLALSLLGGAAGVLLAYWGLKLLIRMAPGDIPRLGEVGFDWRVLGFNLLVSLLTGVFFGLAPALQASRTDLNESLKEGGRGGGSGGVRRGRLRSLLTSAEVALALILLIGCGLMIRSLYRLQQVDPGFRPQNVLTMQIALPPLKYADPEKLVGFYQQSLERVSALPGVQAAGLVSELPLTGEVNDMYFTVEGRPPEDPNQKPVANYRAVTHDYFRAMGIPLLHGRHFTAAEDVGAQAVIINQSMARKYFADRSPIGEHLIIDIGEPLRAEIVGVVGDVRHFSLEAEAFDEMYLPFMMLPVTNLVIRTSVEPLSLVNAVRREVRAVDQDQPVANVRSMEQVVSASLAGAKFRTTLLTIFAACAVALALVGVYGVMSYSVTQRSHEIGVRMALGARRRDVLRLIIAQGLGLTLIGLAVGLAGAFVLTRLVSSLLYEVSATDWLTLAGATLLLLLASVLACYIPARRATRIEPLSALRYE